MESVKHWMIALAGKSGRRFFQQMCQQLAVSVMKDGFAKTHGQKLTIPPSNPERRLRAGA
jgi:hypothetical protein